MKLWQKIGLGVLAVAIGIGVAGYLNRTDLMLAYVKHVSKQDIADNRPIDWQQGPSIPAESDGERPPNIVFILVDDLGINDLSTFGGGVAGGRVPTPNIDKLAADGAIFTQAYSGSATCAVSRAMLMTGRYPTRTGFEYTPTRPGFGKTVSGIYNDMRDDLPPALFDAEADAMVPEQREQGLPSSEITIAEILKERDYHNVHIGKWHLGTGKGFHPLEQGFDESLLLENLLHAPEDDPNIVNAKVDFDPIDNFLWAAGQYSTSYNNGDKFKPGGYLADYWTDESLKVIEANKNRPFFLYLAHWGVHTPLQATRADYEAVGDIKPHRLRVYAAMLRSLDRSVGRIVEKLEAEGLSENTIIVFSSDNGGAGYIGLPGVNQPYRGFKITLFEGGIKVPLFVKWPGTIAKGTRIDTPVAHIDVMPTLAAAGTAALPAGVPIDGRNLIPIASGKDVISRPNDAIFWQSGYYQVVRAGDWKLQVNGKQKKSWLFDLKNDPTEQVNLAEKRPDKLRELKALLAAHQKGRKPPLYASTTDTAIMIDRTLAERFEPGDEYIYWPN